MSLEASATAYSYDTILSMLDATTEPVDSGSTTLNWENLKMCACPKCGNRLYLRLRGRTTNIKGIRSAQLSKDMYFCYRCTFAIGKIKALSLV